MEFAAQNVNNLRHNVEFAAQNVHNLESDLKLVPIEMWQDSIVKWFVPIILLFVPTWFRQAEQSYGLRRNIAAQMRVQN